MNDEIEYKRDLRSLLIEINKRFNDGTIRYDEFDSYNDLKPIEIAKRVASQHPFIDGNKRTAIAYMHLITGKEVPWFVYEILATA